MPAESLERTLEYEAEYPAWRVARASSAEPDCDVAELYGAGLAAALGASPASAFLAEGSAVRVHRGARLDA